MSIRDTRAEPVVDILLSVFLPAAVVVLQLGDDPLDWSDLAPPSGQSW